MFKHILVPLDGSRLAEAAIPPTLKLSNLLGASVTLLHLVETNAPKQVHGDKHLISFAEAEEYLKDTARKYFPSEINTICHTHEVDVRNVARSIAEHSGEFKPDLIILCSHGESGLRNWMVGSIAQQVIGYTKTPLILIPLDHQGKAAQTEFHSFLVAMDGEEEHDRGLIIAAELAQSTGAKIHLLTIVATTDTLSGENAATRRLLPSTMKAMLNFTEENAFIHLEEHAREWRAKGLDVTTEVRRGDPPSEIIHAAAERGDDLIVVGTHGKAGWEAFWSGSVAPKVVNQSTTALLLVPV